MMYKNHIHLNVNINKNKGKIMNKVVLALLLLAATSKVFAGDVADVTFEGGYNNTYLVNGAARTDGESPYAGVSAYKSTKYVDVGVSGVLLPDDGLDQSHWTATFGKTANVYTNVGLRLDGAVTRHQSGVAAVENSTEFGVKLSIVTPLANVYARGSFDIDLQQNGWFVGIQRVQNLPFGFYVTPAVEYGELSDYTAFVAKATLSRPVGVVTPYFEAAWVNNDFQTQNVNFAVRELDWDFVFSAGLKVTF